MIFAPLLATLAIPPHAVDRAASVLASDAVHVASNSPKPDATVLMANGTDKYQKYSYTQLLAFEAFTFPSSSANKFSGCGGQSNERGQCYLGDKDASKDAAARVEIFKKAIDAAYNSASNNATTLKIFLAPEFSFRGTKGAYTVDNLISNDVDIANPLYAYVNDTKFEDWLFVFGTVIAGAEPSSKYFPETVPKNSTVFYNFAPVVKGGRNAKGWLFFKNYISQIDFLDFGKKNRGIQMDPKAAGQPRYAPIPQKVLDNLAPWWKPVTPGHNGDTSLLEVDGLRIALEICLDHAFGMAAKTIKDGPVDVQLIVSAGMNIANGPGITKQFNPTYLADGMARAEQTINFYGRAAVATAFPQGGHICIHCNDQDASPGYPAYDVGPNMYHDAGAMYTAVQQALAGWVGDLTQGVGGYQKPPGYRTSYVYKQIRVKPVARLSNQTEMDFYNKYYYTFPNAVQASMFNATIVDALGTIGQLSPGTDLEQEVAKYLQSLGFGSVDAFSPGVAVYPPDGL